MAVFYFIFFFEDALRNKRRHFARRSGRKDVSGSRFKHVAFLLLVNSVHSSNTNMLKRFNFREVKKKSVSLEGRGGEIKSNKIFRAEESRGE